MGLNGGYVLGNLVVAMIAWYIGSGIGFLVHRYAKGPAWSEQAAGFLLVAILEWGTGQSSPDEAPLLFLPTYLVLLFSWWHFSRKQDAAPSGWRRLLIVCHGLLIAIATLGLATDKTAVVLASMFGMVLFFAAWAVKWVVRGFQRSV